MPGGNGRRAAASSRRRNIARPERPETPAVLPARPAVRARARGSSVEHAVDAGIVEGVRDLRAAVKKPGSGTHGSAASVQREVGDAPSRRRCRRAARSARRCAAQPVALLVDQRLRVRRSRPCCRPSSRASRPRRRRQRGAASALAVMRRPARSPASRRLVGQVAGKHARIASRSSGPSWSAAGRDARSRRRGPARPAARRSPRRMPRTALVAVKTIHW
ncbi:MAG: hypothetical protein MZV64_44865 [Ignavibacteriales bacterium]|nr:hypothetical protein [Ignavibacteriales bacterium]